MRLIWSLAFVAAAGWVALYLSGYGILINEERSRQNMLTCQYFIATQVVEKNYLHAANGILGRAACPRLIQI